MEIVKDMTVRFLLSLTDAAVRNDAVRRFLIKQIEYRMCRDLTLANPYGRPRKVQEDKYYMGRALLRRIDWAIRRGLVSKKATRGLIDIFLGNVFFGGFYKRKKFVEEHGYRPPLFMTISPGKACNLKCTGCYAASEASFDNKLPWDVLDRIIREAKEGWGMNFFVISGGEPLLYRSDGKGILDIYEKHQDCYFLMYTNGTLIKDSVAKRMSDLGNVTPAISVEGLRKETDERRGKGVFDAIIRAMENLRKYGVPFGISITAHRYNVDVIMSDEFMDFYFEQMGALYAWIFQYMPIGRGYTLDLMPTPEQRWKLFEWEWKLVRDKCIFLADFWNSATSSDGCIAAGRAGGYFYINWDGDVAPCVFVPYAVDNIIDIYKKGGTLMDVLNSEFFREIRKWQDEYGYAKPPHEHGNWLAPCFIRDNHDKFVEVLMKCKPYPIDEDARQAMHDRVYHKGMIEYDKKWKGITEEVWKKHYIEPELAGVKK
ncbi:radical SAM protein [bacterium]|nr:MAG: radical SAM protein [bacterium]